MALNENAGKGRKVGRNFASLRATFSRSATPVAELDSNPPPNVAKTLQPPSGSLDRRQSKMTLFDLFSKPKVERARGYGGALETTPERSQTPAHFYAQSDNDQQSQSAEQLRPQSRLSSPTSKISSQRTASSKSPRPPDDWDPPPLFQAYPQSVRHCTIQTTHLSVEALLRAQHLRRQNGGLFGSTTSLPFVREGVEEHGQSQEAQWQAAKRFSTLSDAPELVEKVFVLVTAGRLVQYAGDGNYDRMPEKVLQLGEKSAAFACDLVPGKHWVVQVIQSANEEGVTTINKSRSLLSRLRMPNSAARKTATSFLLVFSSAEEMDAWLRAIRGVIEQLGGKSRKADGEARHSRQNTEEKIEKLPDDLPSHRYRVQRAPSPSQGTRTRSSSSHSQPRSPIYSPSKHPLPSSASVTTHSTAADSPHFPAVDSEGSVFGANRGNSTEASSLATTPASIDQIRLEQLREGSRHSLISIRTSRTSETETVTIPTSRSSSSPPSPQRENFVVSQETMRSPISVTSSYNSPPASTSSQRSPLQHVPANHSSVNIAQAERITRIQRFSPSEVEEQPSPAPYVKPAPVPSTILENPRSRVSLLYSQPISGQQSVERLTRQNSELESSSKFSRPDSVVGQLPNISSRSLNRLDQPRKPFFRPVPIRPSEPSTTSSNRISGVYVPRRFSSLPATAAINSAGPQSTRVATSTFTSIRPRAPSYSLTPAIQPMPPPPSAQAKTLRRPTSMQIRSDPAPFLSSSRRTTASPRSATVSHSPYSAASSPPIPAMHPNRPAIRMRTSMSTIMVPGLPPPAPPPNIPLPAPPPSAI